MSINRNLIKKLPGFIEEAVYERSYEHGNLIYITIAVWECEDVLQNAIEAVQAENKKQGFNPAEMFERLPLHQTGEHIVKWTIKKKIIMSKIFFDAGISLDGFMAGENRGPKNPIGDNGTMIHQWLYKQKAFWKFLDMEGGEEEGDGNDLIVKTFSRACAYIMGKRMFEEGEANWPEDLYKAPVYVLTHEKRKPWVQKGSTVFYFINDGIKSALENAKANAKGKDIRIQGGADTIRQYLNAGCIDEFTIHIAPVIIGCGIRLFDNIDRAKLSIETTNVASSPLVTHITCKVKNL